MGQADKSTRRTTARQPQRKPGQVRFQKLLDALDALLGENNVQEVGLYQIAEKAGVPSASVYHFFPSKEAALLALAEIHHKALQDISRKFLPTRPGNWQELCRKKVSAAARYHNEHPAALRLFLGANISVEIKSADTSQYLRLAEARAEMLDHYFQMPAIPDWPRRLATYFSIIDGVFGLSYAQHGSILDDYVAEAQQAGIAYLRCYLPEIISPRVP